MKPAKKKAISIAALCTAAGAFLSFSALAALDFNYFELGTMDTAENTYVLAETFTNITVNGAECDVRLLPSEDGTCTVVCSETNRIAHTVTVENNTLTIERTDDRKWYEHIGFMWSYRGPIEVLVCLPERTYENLAIQTASGTVEVPDDFSFARAEVDGVSGDIRFEAAVRGDLFIRNVSGGIKINGTNPENLTVRSTSGSVTVDSVEVAAGFSSENVSGSQKVSHVTCQSAAASSISGGVAFSDLIASESIRMESVSGRLDLTRCDADTLWLKTVSGSVTGTLCTGKRFVTSTASGRVSVPDTVTGGRCEAETVSGDIQLDVIPVSPG